MWRKRLLAYPSKHLSQSTAKDFPFIAAEISYSTGQHSNASKLSNLSLGIKHLDNLVIPPGSCFSFWQTIGRPTICNGFQASRSIVAGKIQNEIGGGLCQLSGMLFHLALIAGLKIIERHSHSVDIYQEQERYCELGLDAAVAFPYKDLVLINQSSCTFQLKFSNGSSNLNGAIYSDHPNPKHDIQITRLNLQKKKETLTRAYREGTNAVEFFSSYSNLNNSETMR